MVPPTPAARVCPYAVTDADTIDTRTDHWDPATECTAADRQVAADEAQRAEMLASGRALLADQVGLDEVKRAVAELEDQIEVRALRLAHGLPVAGQTATDSGTTACHGKPA